jgi:ABC-type bacteriocin/lantibiotic exporter with double-glycine peptidase domain
LGLVKPTGGRLSCDGWNIHHHIRAWHKNVGYVAQDLYFSPKSIRENVAFGIPAKRIDDEKVNKALALASAEDFVRALPGGVNHRLRSGATNLSGGQRQRLIIARALYNDPDIVIFDEATAALDNATEREITQAIQELSGTKTVICVAHRLSTIEKSDKIYVIEDGSVSGVGTYDELLESNPSFQKLALDPDAS